MSQRREAVQEAYAGDIVGFTTHGGVQLGDTITDGSVNLLFTGLPFFAPEMFMICLHFLAIGSQLDSLNQPGVHHGKLI